MSDDPQTSMEADSAVEQLIAMIIGHRANQNHPETIEQRSDAAVPESESESDFCQPYVYETLYCKSLHFSAVEVQSRMLKREPDTLALDYTRTMMGFLLFNPKPKRIAMIGLGGGSLAKFCYRHLPDARIDVVEVNPHVLALRDEFQVPKDDERFRVHLADGARFIADASKRYDAVLVDGYTRHGVPPALSSQSFFRQCRRALRPDGIMVFNLNCDDSDAHIGRIRRCFPGTVFTVDETTCTNRIVFAFASTDTQPPRVKNDRQIAALDSAASLQLKRNFATIVAAMPQT